MVSLITKGVKVSVETFYQADVSQPANNEFRFIYRITIENNSSQTIKLLRRKWVIVDGYGKENIVQGDGVIGKQPIIEPNGYHQYVSGCLLKTEIGKMSGTYAVEKLIDNSAIDIVIPEFKLVAPFKLN